MHALHVDSIIITFRSSRGRVTIKRSFYFYSSPRARRSTPTRDMLILKRSWLLLSLLYNDIVISCLGVRDTASMIICIRRKPMLFKTYRYSNSEVGKSQDGTRPDCNMTYITYGHGDAVHRGYKWSMSYAFTIQ